MIEDTDQDLAFGDCEGMCQACDAWTALNDIGLCEECAAKVDRDMIRKRDWEYSAAAFGYPVDQREALRQHIIAQYGEPLEILAAEPTRATESRGRRRKRREKR
jgi:hypothetical protein